MNRFAALLIALCAAGLALGAPYIYAVYEAMPLPISPASALAAQAVQILVLCAICAYAGLRFAPREGLDAPWLRAIAERGDRPPFWSIAIESAMIGSITAIVVTAVALMPRSPLTESLLHPPGGFWARASAALYGGIVEETICRWGLLTVLAALLRRAGLRVAFWPANVFSAFVFAGLHLPLIAATRIPLTPAVVTQAMLGNGIAGTVFGWVFRRRGLEGAMVAHGAADIWLHAALPALLA